MLSKVFLLCFFVHIIYVCFHYLEFGVYVQTMNILIVNQSVIDMSASFFTLLTAVVEVDGTRMSRDSSYDQFVCRIWLTRTPLWCFLFTSTYNILLTTLERYVAVIYHVWYNKKVRSVCRLLSAAGRLLDLPAGNIRIWSTFQVHNLFRRMTVRIIVKL